VLRGIHFAKNPPGQAKLVTCPSGEILDVVVDLRKDSETFGKWDSAMLNSKNRSMLFIPSGVGHAFMSLKDFSVVMYLCNEKYNPTNEFEINPLDPDLGINWPTNLAPILSQKDSNAPFLRDFFINLQK